MLTAHVGLAVGDGLVMEIALDLDLSMEKTSLLDMHTVLNILNVVIHEVLQLAKEMGPSRDLDELIDATVRMAAILLNPEDAHRQLVNVEAYIGLVLQRVTVVARERGVEDTPSYKSRRDNLESVFNVLRIRAAELVARRADPDAWLQHLVSKLEKSIATVLHAIERNSRGGYRIATNVAAHHEGDYLGDGTTLRCVAQDTGRKIAPSEIEIALSLPAALGASV